MAKIFLTGATGYMGRALIGELKAKEHHVRALARRGSEHRVPAGCETVVGDALDESSYRDQVTGADTFCTW